MKIKYIKFLKFVNTKPVVHDSVFSQESPGEGHY